MNSVRRVVVAIPARDEEHLLIACLAGVNRAVAALGQVRPDVDAVVVVGLDNCTDSSAAVAARAGIRTFDMHGEGVGATRDAAIRHGLAVLGPSVDAEHVEGHTWLACTDADTVVPSTWLIRQVMWAESGMNLVIGTVEPIGGSDPAVLAAWHSRHRLGEGHPYVHGANLGMRAETWRATEGFGHRTLGEDVALVARAQARNDRWVATDTTRVATSGRLTGRADGGFADYLKALGEPQ